MQYKIFRTLPSYGYNNQEHGYVSFKKFSEFLEEKLHQSDALRAKFYRFTLKHFKKNPELLSPIKIDQLEKYAYLFELLEEIILPHLANEKETALALGTPDTGEFFLSTAAFYELIKLASGSDFLEPDEEVALFLYRRNKLRYMLVLERFYNFEPLIKEKIVHPWTSPDTGLSRYFDIEVDNRFVDITHRDRLPEINVTQVQQQLASNASLEELEKTLPLSSFFFTGFSIVTATDITSQYALHKMRSAIIRHNAGDYNKTHKTVLELITQLCGRKNVTFGLLPFLKLNDRLVSYYGNYEHSIVINISRKLNIPEAALLGKIDDYLKNTRTIISKKCSNEREGSDALCNAFSQLGYDAFALVPVFYNNEVAGMLEVSVEDAGLLDEALLSRVDPAIPILGQLMHQSQTEFSAAITNVMQTNFTPIQSSVLWKFNEAAWDHIRNIGKNAMKTAEEIRFNDVHPFYGAIDIRNSTLERNNALQKDIRYYISLVKNTLGQVHASDKIAGHTLDEEADNLLKQTQVSFTGNEESVLNALMERVAFYLKDLENDGSHNKNIIKKYVKDIDEKTGRAYLHRRILENSMQYINFIISDYLEGMQTDIQKKYPVYFEKVRTDGIEYDMYLGQSISPKRPYNKEYLNELRLMQLKSMASIARLVHASAQTLPVPLKTTQLIYVNASAIDITFRMDEKRFDVEGGYNIRYQIVKKRIDKVHVRNTGERLTQPGKLVIIYSQPQHEKEYIGYINELQQHDIFGQDVELLELEELQGVTGLKAIRVEVNFNK